MKWANCVQKLINHNLERSLNFQEKLEELRIIDYTSEAPLFFIDTLSKLNFSIQNKLMQYNNIFIETSQDKVCKALVNQIQFLSAFLTELYYFTLFIEFSDTIQNPISISLPIKRLTEKLLPDDVIFTYPSYVCNYFCFYFQKYLKESHYSKYLSPDLLNKPIILLGFPSILKNNFLSHAVIAHELGHLLGDRYNIFRDAKKTISEEVSSKIIEVSSEKLDTFFKEYIADIISIYLFGPASFFALIEFAGSINRFHQSGTSHPPLYLRLKNMLNTMDVYHQRTFFSKKASDPVELEIMKKANQVLCTWERLIREGCEQLRYSINIDIFKILTPGFKKAIELIRERIDKQFQLELTDRILNYVKDFIDKGIPPSADLNQNSCKPAKLGELLNAGWLYRIWKLEERKKFKSLQEQRKYTHKLKDLSRLEQKAIEQSESIRWFQKRKENASHECAF